LEYFTEAYREYDFDVDLLVRFLTALACGARNVAEAMLPKINLDDVHDLKRRLQAAVKMGSESIVAAVLGAMQSRATAETPLDTASLPLSLASEPAIIERLLEAKAEVNPDEGDSVLKAACLKLRPDAVKMLLDAKADVNKRTTGASPLFYAMETMNEDTRVAERIDLINLLFDAGVHSTDGSQSAFHVPQHIRLGLRGNITPLVSTLLARSPGLLESRDGEGCTPLMAAVTADPKFPELVDALIAAGADVNARDGNNQSVISCLCSSVPRLSTGKDLRGVREILGQLLSAGADPTACPDSGTTALMALMLPSRWAEDEDAGEEVHTHGIPEFACKAYIADILDSILTIGSGAQVHATSK
jgi:hypothetical protein